jgi:hypothetical protein
MTRRSSPAEAARRARIEAEALWPAAPWDALRRIAEAHRERCQKEIWKWRADPACFRP